MILVLLILILCIPVIRRIVFDYFPLIPSFIYWKVIDVYRYFKNKEWKIFDGFGLHIFVGLFGKGKTISMVERAYRIAKKYPYVNIYTNIELKNFPVPQRIYKLTSYKQIIDAPGDSLFVIDEISTLFQSRNWSSFPMPLLSQLLQVRKKKKMILATAQLFEHVDKLIRDVTFSVIDCNNYFSRWQFATTYLAFDWERANVMQPAKPVAYHCFIQTDKIRASYDTYEMIDNLKKEKFLSSEEILTRQASNESSIVAVEKPKKRLFGNRK